MKLDEMRLAVHPGNGLVARFERTILLVVNDSRSATTVELVEACRNAEGAAEKLRAIGSSRSAGGPAFFALVDQGDVVLSFIAGVMKVSIETDKSRLEFASTDPQGWMEEALRGNLKSVAVAERTVKIGGQPLGDLVLGVVTGGGVELIDRSAPTSGRTKATAPAGLPVAKAQAPAALAPEPDPQPAVTAREPESEPETSEPELDEPVGIANAEQATDQTVLIPAPPDIDAEPASAHTELSVFEQRATMAGMPGLSTLPPPAPDAMTIEGHECANGHLNDPLAPSCRVCGSPVLDTVGRGPRPPLGRLIGKDGGVAIVDRDYLLGRKPEDAPEVIAGDFTPLPVPHSEAGVSRIHCEVRISGWNVLLTDRNSANGTFLRPAGLSEWIRLEPGHTVQLVLGSAVSIGGYEFSFEG